MKRALIAVILAAPITAQAWAVCPGRIAVVWPCWWPTWAPIIFDDPVVSTLNMEPIGDGPDPAPGEAADSSDDGAPDGPSNSPDDPDGDGVDGDPSQL